MAREKFQTLTEQMFYILLCLRQEQCVAETRVEGRRRSYLITQTGQAALEDEYRRLKTLAADYERLTGGRET